MKLTELLQKQHELNEVIGAYPETPEQLAFALVEECGEVARELRSKWRWWAWSGQIHKESRGRFIEELADVLTFSLMGLLCFGEAADTATASKYWETDWGRFCYDDSFEAQASNIINAFPDESGWSAIASVIRTCAHYNVSREEIEAAYLKKWQKNMKRCEAA